MQYSPQSEYGKYRTQAQIHLDSLSTVGRTIGKEAESAKVILMSALLYRCETWNVGFTLHQWNTMIKLTLARHDQSTNSSAPCEEFFQLIRPCFTKQEKTETGGEIKCSQLERWTSMNHLVEFQIALQHWHENPKSHRGSRRNTHGAHSQENYKETSKPTQFMWRVRNLHAQNLARMEEFDWHDILNNRRNDKENTVGCDQSDYQTWW